MLGEIAADVASGAGDEDKARFGGAKVWRRAGAQG